MPEIIQLPQNGGNQNGGMILPVANGGGLFGNNGQDLKEQMREQMRHEFRGINSNGNIKTVGHQFENGYREGYRHGYEQAMRDSYAENANIENMSPSEREAYLKGRRDAYGSNDAENRKNF